MVPQLRYLSYEERLLNLGISNLEERRVRGDMIQMFKIQNNFNTVELSALKINCNKNYAEFSGPAETVLIRRRANISVAKEVVKKCKARETYFTNRMAERIHGTNSAKG
jgi:hypothetical protein